MAKSNTKNRAVAGPTLNLIPSPKCQDDASPGEQAPVFGVTLDGVPLGTWVEITFWEVSGPDDGGKKEDRELGRIQGTTSSLSAKKGWCSFDPEKPLPTREQAIGMQEQGAMPPVLVSFEVVTPRGAEQAYFRLEDANAHTNEGDAWEVKATATPEVNGEVHPIASPVVRVSRLRRRVPASKASHPARVGNRIEFYNDGFDDAGFAKGAFVDMVKAIGEAQHFIFAADWSFHPLFRPMREGPFAEATPEGSIGALLLDKAKAGVTVAIHTWDHTSVVMTDKQNDAGQDVLVAIAGGKLPDNIHWRKSSRSGAIGYLASSHHQKMLVMDYPEKDGRIGIRVFLGGLDLTKGRLDHHGHPVAPPPNADGLGDKTTWAYAQKWSAGAWTTDEWYNAETGDDRALPRQPWHDVHARLEGPAAWDYLREFVGRWLAADEKEIRQAAFLRDVGALDGGLSTNLWSSVDDTLRETNPILALYVSLFDRSKVVSMKEPLADGKWCVQVCRSLEKSHWNVPLPPGAMATLPKDHHWSLAYGFEWNLPASREQSILEAYRNGIDQAEKFIYIENQYFIGYGAGWGGEDGAKNDIPQRLVRKIRERREANMDFHVYIVMPMFPEGNPGSSSLQELRACEAATIEYMIRNLGDGWEKYLSFYFLANWSPVHESHWLRPDGDISDRDFLRKHMLARHKRYMIYVHTKMMIVDDRYVILGSCNLNDRGLMGDGDSEICASIWPMLRHQEKCIEKVKHLRRKLWQEHFGAGLPAAWETPEKKECWSDARTKAFANYKALRETTRDGTEGHICLWNFMLGDKGVRVKDSDPKLGVGRISCPEPNQCIPDAPYVDEGEANDEGWTWKGQFKTLIPRFLVE